MAEINTQQAINRISTKIKELTEALKLITTNNTSGVTTLNSEVVALQQQAAQLESGKVSKQLRGNVDFTNFEELSSLINDDDFVSISMADGQIITGRTIGKDVSKITLSGWRVNSTDDVSLYGTISILNDLSLDGGSEIGKSKDFFIPPDFDTYDWTKAKTIKVETSELGTMFLNNVLATQITPSLLFIKWNCLNNSSGNKIEYITLSNLDFANIKVIKDKEVSSETYEIINLEVLEY